MSDPKIRVIEGCRHPLERMTEWANNGGCPICLTAELASANAPQPLDWEIALRAAEAANAEFGQWMPQQWLDLFRTYYNTGQLAARAVHGGGGEIG